MPFVLLLFATWLAASAAPQPPSTIVTVRVLVKTASTTGGVAKTEWLPGSGYFVKIGDTQNPARYCSSLHLDPPARVECAVPAGRPVIIRIDRPSFSGQCPAPFPTSSNVPLSVTARVDLERKTLSCRTAP